MDLTATKASGTFGSIGTWDESWFGTGREDILGDSGEWRTLFDIEPDPRNRASAVDSLKNPNDELFSLLALASVAFGVRGRTDFVLPFIAHGIWWVSGNKGVDAIYSVMAGQQTARKQYKTAALPALKDIFDFFNTKTSFEERWQKTLWYVIGFLVSFFKIL